MTSIIHPLVGSSAYHVKLTGIVIPFTQESASSLAATVCPDGHKYSTVAGVRQKQSLPSL